ncbi:MFS transporter [Bradyrhizobium sp. 33ap4]|uniref:MFS transporter n=1 Tax=Bradyrhizobium sp. 33ap4 TaxID=3061630 RepID=UPI003977A59E
MAHKLRASCSALLVSGAVVGALSIGELRKRIVGEAAVRACSVSMSSAIAVVALSRDPVLTASALVLGGAAWTITWTLFSIGVQVSAPRRVAGRLLAAHQAAQCGGMAIGGWCWGRLTDVASVEIALLASAALMLLSSLLGLWLRMLRISAHGQDAKALAEPEVQLAPPTAADRLWWRSNIA